MVFLRRLGSSRPALPVAVLVSLGSVIGGPLPEARASLLTPMLQLFRPQLEGRLAEVCLSTAAGSDPLLRRNLQDPCRKLAGPTSRCLIEETDSSGRGLEVLREMVGGRFGEASEVVVKRCLARMFGLPPDSLQQVPLRELSRRFGPRQLAPAPEATPLPPSRP